MLDLKIINLNIRISTDLKNRSATILTKLKTNQSRYIRDALQYIVDHESLPWIKQTNNAGMSMSSKEELQLIHKGAAEAKKRLLFAHEATIDALQGVRNKYTETEKLDPLLEERFKAIFAEAQEGLSWLDALINSTRF